MKKAAVLLLAALTVLSSCHTMSDLRIDKRHYRKGWYVHVRPKRSTDPVEVARAERPVPQYQRAEPVAQQSAQPGKGSEPGTAPVNAVNPPPVTAPQNDDVPSRSMQQQTAPAPISQNSYRQKQ